MTTPPSEPETPDYPPCRTCGKATYFYAGDDICMDCKDWGFDNLEEMEAAFRKLHEDPPDWFKRADTSQE